jgi:hypothetical protein
MSLRVAKIRGLSSVIIAVLTLGLAGSAAGAPNKILVLPVDGAADAATRARLTTRIVRLARTLDGQVATGETTFADAALAVGCDPSSAGCSEQVIATLAVDELVWGTTTKIDRRSQIAGGGDPDGSAGGAGGKAPRGIDRQIRLSVRRATRGLPAREVLITITPGEPMERVDAAMAPLFGPPRAAGEPESTPGAPTAPIASSEPAPGPSAPREDGAPIASAPPGVPGKAPGVDGPRDTPAPVGDHRDRNLGIGLTVGGGGALVLGLALLGSYASLQGRIDDHDTGNRDDFDDLTTLEDRAARYAIAGDVLVVAGLAAGSVGVYYLYRNHKRRVVVAPTPMGAGAGLTLTILGAP